MLEARYRTTLTPLLAEWQEMTPVIDARIRFDFGNNTASSGESVLPSTSGGQAEPTILFDNQHPLEPSTTDPTLPPIYLAVHSVSSGGRQVTKMSQGKTAQQSPNQEARIRTTLSKGVSNECY